MRLPPKPRPPDPLKNLLACHPEYGALAITLVPHGDAGAPGRHGPRHPRVAARRDHARESLSRACRRPIHPRTDHQCPGPPGHSSRRRYPPLRPCRLQSRSGADQPTITTSYQAVYGKLGRLQPAVSEAVVRYGAERCQQLLTLMPGACREPRPGYRVRVLDGNVLAGTDHRLTPLRRWLNACLPGKSLVVYEPGPRLVTDVVLCEDAYTQERALLTQILPRVQRPRLVHRRSQFLHDAVRLWPRPGQRVDDCTPASHATCPARPSTR